MHSEKSLAQQNCVPLPKDRVPLQEEQAAALCLELHENWRVTGNGKVLMREFLVKGFAKAVFLTNSCCFIADQQDHHPDIELGWGYCRVHFTTHSVGGLSLNDFICAARLDALVDN